MCNISVTNWGCLGLFRVQTLSKQRVDLAFETCALINQSSDKLVNNGTISSSFFGR